MQKNPTFDVFLSHSSKDKEQARAIARRLQKDGLKVWFDEWVIKAGDSILAKIEEGLEHSRILVLCMSANAFGSEWAQLEAGTFRFRDPLNKQRRFIPLRLDDAAIKGSLAQFLYVNWSLADREGEYAKLLEACSPSEKPPISDAEVSVVQPAQKVIQLQNMNASIMHASIYAYAFSPKNNWILASSGGRLGLWDLNGYRVRVFEDAGRVVSVAWSSDERFAISASLNGILRLWDVETGCVLQAFGHHSQNIDDVALSKDGRYVLSASEDSILRLWDVNELSCIQSFKGHTGPIRRALWSSEQGRILSGADDGTLRLWHVSTGRCLYVLEGHTSPIFGATLNADGSRAISASDDKTLRLWDLKNGRCLRVFIGHTDRVVDVEWSPDQRYAISGSEDQTMRFWEVETGRCLRVLEGHTNRVRGVAWSADGRCAFSSDRVGNIRTWDFSEFIVSTEPIKDIKPELPVVPNQVLYTNAKVLIVGESGAGKTGLSIRLVQRKWKASDSTIGAWATQWKLPLEVEQGIEREIWLWDFGGQADQRLIHQLYMDETALAVLVFDGQKEDLFEMLGQWDRDLTRASSKDFTKLLVAGRVDAGGLRVSRNQVDAFRKERGYEKFLETSAKADIGCDELKKAILEGIRWENIPWRSSPVLFKRLKEEIIRLKDAGQVLMRLNQLAETLRLRLAGEKTQFEDEELKAVIGLLAGPGIVWELKFGSWILFQPERINAYAQAVIQTLRACQEISISN